MSDYNTIPYAKVPMFIVHNPRTNMYWSNELGWVNMRQKAEVFTPKEQNDFSLPSDGIWRPAWQSMTWYTVLLAYPDYVADLADHQTLQLYVVAEDARQAIAHARGMIDHVLYLSDGEDFNPDDFVPLAVYAGRLDDLNPGDC